MQSLTDKWEQYTALTEKALHGYLTASTIPEPLQKVMAYSVFAGGKRLRPALVLAACEVCGGKKEEALPFAAAVEMIHTYSLIHDDLPAMDNDDYRRGRLTSHKMFGEDQAILAGDALLSLAFETALHACVRPEWVKAAMYLAQAAGASGMVAGQWNDVTFSGRKISEDEMYDIHRHKTGDLIIGSLKAGAAVALATEEQLLALERYGAAIGQTFQIVDDILDVTGDSRTLGKDVGQDISNGKTTYVSLFGLEGAQKKAQEHTHKALAELEHLSGDTSFLADLALFLLQRKK